MFSVWAFVGDYSWLRMRYSLSPLQDNPYKAPDGLGL